MRLIQAILAGLLSGLCAAAADSAVSFRREIAPLLVAKCQACHNAEKAKGSYRLHTMEALRKPGSSKELPVVPGQPEASLLYRLLVAPNDEDRMPQNDPPLSAPDIARLRLWIEQGARFDGPDPGQPLALLAVPQHPAPPVSYARPIPVTALAFAPSGELLAAGGYHEVTLWNPADGQLRQRLTNLAERTFDLAFSPDGRRLASASGTPGRIGELKLLSPDAPNQAQLIFSGPDAVLAAAFSPDGTILASGGTDNAIRLWETGTGRLLRTIEQHADWVLGLAFSPDGQRLVSGSRDKSARLFSVATGELEETYTGQSDFITSVAWADEKSILSASRTRTVHRWNQKEAKRTAEFRLGTEDPTRLGVEGRRLFCVSLDGSLREYPLAGGRESERVWLASGPALHSLAIHPGRRLLAIGDQDGQVRIWNSADGQLLQRFSALPGLPHQLTRSK